MTMITMLLTQSYLYIALRNMTMDLIIGMYLSGSPLIEGILTHLMFF